MPITYHTGDATAPVGNGVKIIVHICNDLGAWGKGVVLAVSRRWPEPERRYRAWARGKEDDLPFTLGQVQFVQVAPDIYVANLLGQHGIRRRDGIPPIRYEAVRQGLQRVAASAIPLHASIHMPRIGCGLAGGTWEEIVRLIEEELVDNGLSVTVYDLPENPRSSSATERSGKP